jgi:hypothetical protein
MNLPPEIQINRLIVPCDCWLGLVINWKINNSGNGIVRKIATQALSVFGKLMKECLSLGESVAPFAAAHRKQLLGNSLLAPSTSQGIQDYAM